MYLILQTLHFIHIHCCIIIGNLSVPALGSVQLLGQYSPQHGLLSSSEDENECRDVNSEHLPWLKAGCHYLELIHQFGQELILLS